MLEIIVVIFMVRSIGKIVHEKGGKAWGYQLLLIVLWLLGELIGAIIGALVVGGDNILVMWIFALVGALAGAKIAFEMAKNATPGTTA